MDAMGIAGTKPNVRECRHFFLFGDARSLVMSSIDVKVHSNFEFKA
jgi:hypothetical protein